MRKALLLSHLCICDQLCLCIYIWSSYVTFSNFKFSPFKKPWEWRYVQSKHNKMTQSLYNHTNHTKHTTPPEKWQHFTCSQSQVPERPSVSVNYEWAIKFLFTLNVPHFLIMRHWSISSSEIRFLISCGEMCKIMHRILAGHKRRFTESSAGIQQHCSSRVFCT